MPCLAELAELAEVTGKSANLAVFKDDHVVYVAQVPGRHRMRMFTRSGAGWCPTRRRSARSRWPGVTPTRCSACSDAWASWSTPPTPLTTPEAFTAALAVVRRQGWGVDDEEEELGVRCVAVPVGPGGRAVAAISVPGPASRLAVTPELLGAMGRAADRCRGGRWRALTPSCPSDGNALPNALVLAGTMCQAESGRGDRAARRGTAEEPA